jgi:CPA1 family monovalent cation:H+ antiporter
VVTEGVALGLAALAVVLAARWISDRLQVPFPVLLAVIGGVYALLPGPNAALRPDVVLTAVIPPVLYSAALDASLLDIRRYLRPDRRPVRRPGHRHCPGRWRGAPAGRVRGGSGRADHSAGRRRRRRRRGLLHRSGHWRVHPSRDRRRIVGVAVAWLLSLLRPLRQDALSVTAISLATPFACYLVGEELHVSGVLAVVIAGLIAGHRAPRTETSTGRLQGIAVWRLVDFLLEGLVFLLIGQQVPRVVRTLHDDTPGTVLAVTVATLGVVLLLRPVWLAGTQLLPGRYRLTVEGTDARPFTAAELTMLTWSGTRGVITLAAAHSPPLGLPQRDLLLYCAFLVVAVTLLGQGLTFAPLARRLRDHGNRGRPGQRLRRLSRRMARPPCRPRRATRRAAALATDRPAGRTRPAPTTARARAPGKPAPPAALTRRRPTQLGPLAPAPASSTRLRPRNSASVWSPRRTVTS